MSERWSLAKRGMKASIRTAICPPGRALSCRLCRDRYQSACSPMTCRSPERVVEEYSLLVAIFGFATFEQGIDRHRVPMPQVKILFEPGHDVARFDAWLDNLPIGEPFFGGKPAEILRAFAGLGLDGVQVALE